jgi:sigma-B regulation protein RsbU (phosphoserine phosphatase)
VVADELELRHTDTERVCSGDRERRLLHLAETVQDGMAPVLPDLPGMAIAAYGRPAPGEPVGGDFYDGFPLEQGTWGLFLGDVTGKGPKAAALTALSRYTLRTTAILDQDPASTLRDLNTVLLTQGSGIDDDWLPLCTAAYAQVRPPVRPGEPAHVSVACAGHPPPLLVRPGRLTELVDCLGMVPGVRPDPVYRPSEVTLYPGDALVFYTDGFTDARRGGARLEIDGLRIGLSGRADTSAEAIVARLAELLGDGPEATRDDATALVVTVP